MIGHSQPRAIELIDRAELHRRCEAQGVSDHSHWALRCVMCGTVQSPASLNAAGASWDRVNTMIGFACEGRLTGAGPWPNSKDHSAAAKRRRLVRGCDWTLGGLFRLHKLEVRIPAEGDQPATTSPCFEVATPEEAKALEALVGKRPRPDKPEETPA